MTDYQQILEECLMRVANGTSTVDECLARYPEHATQLRPLLRTILFLNLGPGRNPAPAPKAPAYASFLTRLLRSRPLQPRTMMMPLAWRTSLAFAMLVVAFLITGTARAQSALPGEPFYGWKRASEEVWRAVSTDQVATDITLSNRRLNEWIAVADDPTQSDLAMDDYFQSLDRLKSVEDAETIARILPVLRSHHDKLNELNDDRYSADELDDYVVAEVQDLSGVEVTQVSSTDLPQPAPVPTDEPGPIKPEPTEPEPAAVPSEPAPTAGSTEPAPTAVPTEPAPTEPAPTAVSTEPAPTESAVPTDIVPTLDILEITPIAP